MENRTQPILCCVGADVAGQPTQFLMERAVLASHLDWHVITVEVASDQLAKAWDGMNVMQFQAVRFFPTHQQNALQLVSDLSVDDLFIAGITSAMRVGDKWVAWHNSGPALLDLISKQVVWENAVCWVHGESVRSRSFLVACKSKPPRKIYWTGAQPPAVESAGEAVNESSEAASEAPPASGLHGSASHGSALQGSALPGTLEGLPLKIVSKEQEVELASQLASDISDDTTQAVVHVGELDPKHLDMLLTIQPQHTCSLAIVSATPGSRRKLSEAWKSGEVIVLSPADLVVAEEAYDQQRWTGQPANVDLLREAYEEYVDF